MHIHPTTLSPSSSAAANHPTTTNSDPMHQWWESISKARSTINSLSTILPSLSSSISLLADSDRPALSLLFSSAAYSAVSDHLRNSPISGSGPDPLCQWLYDTYLSSDPALRLVVLSYLPIVTNLYLENTVNVSVNSLAGFEAVLLAIYAGEVRARGGQALTVSVPDLSLPSLYHSPVKSRNPNVVKSSVGVVCKVLEPLNAVKSTKRACIVGVALDCYYKQIAQMPSCSKVDLCEFVSVWAGQDCTCKDEFDRIEILGFSNGRDSKNDDHDDEIVHKVDQLNVNECDDDINNDDLVSKGVRIPLPWELLQPIVRILGHCLLGPLSPDDVKDAASTAVRCLYARASHELVPQAILATRSLIQLDKRSRAAKKMAVNASNAASNANTSSKAKKPEILLVSK